MATDLVKSILINPAAEALARAGRDPRRGHRNHSGTRAHVLVADPFNPCGGQNFGPKASQRSLPLLVTT